MQQARDTQTSYRGSDALTSLESLVGSRMKDGTIFAGISPDTGKQMFLKPATSNMSVAFYRAQEDARQSAHGHKDWHVPTKGEMETLLKNKEKGALKAIFNARPSGSYWTSTPAGSAGLWVQSASSAGPSTCFETSYNLACFVR